MEPKSTNNHGNRWLEALWDRLWHISGSKVVPGSILGGSGMDLGRHFGSMFEVIFVEKLTLSVSFFSYLFERRFFRILMDFGAHFHDFSAQKRLRNRKGENMKNLCFIDFI